MMKIEEIINDNSRIKIARSIWNDLFGIIPCSHKNWLLVYDAVASLMDGLRFGAHESLKNSIENLNENITS